MVDTHLGDSLKRQRLDRKMTLEELAKASDVSRSMISKIERGEAVPTTSTLGRLAEALDLSISQLVGGKAASGPVHIAAAQQPQFSEPGTGFIRRSVSPLYRGRGVDLALNSLPPGASTGPFPSHRRGVEEHLYVEAGRLRVEVGDESWELAEGDYLFYPADRDHSFHNDGVDEVRFLIVIDSTQLR